ncbi:bifunctional protein-serine/threonine kinase/phosphatase [Psychrobacter piscatorii]|uniref:non-specific serine/threonine protein kinase n=1 Tax=Psychrobacter piscatorii TaxID=554343 RepID=A0A0T6DRN7_9GAMM|nr:bifunctional protein-serine/threonine kinase/phosphatase [Psychrobacter piscatorii]KRU22328.1 serine/threonine protein kinase [Psychrobacter piscatorii]
MHESVKQAPKQTNQVSSHDADVALWLPDFCTMAGRKADNQDSLLITTCLPYGFPSLSSSAFHGAYPSFTAPLLVLMADGVSACQFPKQASQSVINTVTHHITSKLAEMVQTDRVQANEISNESQEQSPNPLHRFDDDQVAIVIKEAVHQANDALYFPQAYERLPALLSTLSGLLCIGDRIHLFHTGDSRIYRIGIDSMVLLTKDHHIHHGRDKGALSAAIGADTRVELQQSVFTLHQNECLALMTDGVYESITPAELQFELCAAVQAMHQSVACPNQIIDHLQMSQRLCEHAFSEGSHDNLSVIMLGMNDEIIKSKTHRETDNGIALDQGVDSDSSHAQDINHYRLPTGLAVGAQIDNFVVKKIIARTARSEVYLVEDNDQHAFVLKSPSLNVIADGHYLREFLKERKIGLSLSKHKRIGEPAYNQVNPNSVSSHDPLLTSDVSKKLNATFNASNASGLLRYYPVPASSTYLYHLTEYIEGESLRVFMDRQAPCDIWQTYDLLTKIGMAVRVMHRNYLLHQDIKPENILLTQSGAVKLIDFGSASSSILKDSTRPPNGDLHYAAPEYYTDAPKGVHSDLFSIAVIGYELLTGELPFSSQELMNPSASLIVPAERLRQNRVPATSQQALMRALHSSTQARYQAIGEFLQDFNPDNSNNTRDPEPLIIRHPLLVWHSICFIQFVIIISLLIYFS